MKYLIALSLIVDFAFAKYDVIYNQVKLAEIKNMDTIKDNYLEIDVTNKFTSFIISKDKIIVHNDKFNKKNEKNVKYKKDKYQVLNTCQKND